MATALNPSIILAGEQPVYQDPDMQYATLQSALLKNQLGAQQVQAAKYQNQETARQLAEQDALMKATNDAIARRAAATSGAGAPTGIPAPSAGFAQSPEGFVVRDPAYGQVAGENDQILPGIVGVTPNTGTSPAPPVTPSPARPADPRDNMSVYEEALNSLPGKVRPSTLAQWNSTNLAMKEKAANVEKTTADAQKAEQEKQLAHADALGALLQTVKDAGYTRTAMQGAIGYMASHGFGDDAKSLLTLVNANPDNIQGIVDPFLSQISAARVTANSKDLTARTGAQKTQAELPEMQAKADQAQRANFSAQLANAPDEDTYNAITAKMDPNERALVPDFNDPDRVDKNLMYGQTSQERAQNELRAKEVAKLTDPAQLAYAAEDPNRSPQERSAADAALKRLDQYQQAGRPTQTTMMNFGSGTDANGQPLSGEAFLQTLPTSMRAEVKAIAEGRQSYLPRGAQGELLLRAVNQYDPGYSVQRTQLRSAFTTGKQGQNIGALNTATVHLDQLADAADAMQNHSFVPGNAVYNKFVSTFGGNAATNFEALKNAVVGEMANALKGNATDEEIKHIMTSFQNANSPAQLSGAIRTSLHVLGAKLNTYDEQYHQQMPNDQWSPVLPSARAVYQKNGITPLASQQQNGNPGHRVGDTRSYQGATYKFDGKQWVKQ